MNPSPEQIVERERRLAPYVAATAFASFVLLTVSLILGGSKSYDSVAERYRDVATGTASDQIVSGIIAAVALLALAPILVFLFNAARARSAPLRTGLLVLVVLGPVLVAASIVIRAAALPGLADDFVEAEAAAPSVDLASPDPDEISRVVIYPGEDTADDDAADVELDDGAIAAVEIDEDLDELTSRLEEAEIEVEEDDRGDPADLQVEEVTRDSGPITASSGLAFGGFVALVVGVAYTLMNAMRVGLLPRIFATFGMALAIGQIFLGPTPLVFYFAAVGLIVLGRWPGGSPPAWQTGKAEPWPKPGEPVPGEGEEDVASSAEEAFAGELEPEPDIEPGKPEHPRSKKKRKRR